MKTLSLKLAMTLLLTTAVVQATGLPQRGPIPFAAYDRDGNGAISELEFEQVRGERMRARASEGRPMRGMANPPSFSGFDSNGDGVLSADELSAGQQQRMLERRGDQGVANSPGRGMGRNMPAFADFDLNWDGILHRDEFIEARGRRISERVKQGYPMRGLANIQSFDDVDSNGNGLITQAEFAAAQARHAQKIPR